MSGKKYSQEEFMDILNRSGYKNFAFSCKDDFGEYGIVGFGQYRVENNWIIFTEFAMSCRVAGKYVESALFTFLLQLENCQSGKFEILITKKNGLLRNTLKEIGFSINQESSNRVKYQFGDKLLHSELVKVEGGL